MVERKEQAETVSIGLGTLFLPLEQKGILSTQTRMVINPFEPEESISSVTVEDVTDRGIPKWKIISMGTIKPKSIGMIIDHVSKEAVLEGFMNDQPAIRNDIEKLINDCAAKGNRQLKIRVTDLSQEH
jgi:hypothetical protein